MPESEKSFRQIALETLQRERLRFCYLDEAVALKRSVGWRERRRREAYERWIEAVIAFRRNQCAAC